MSKDQSSDVQESEESDYAKRYKRLVAIHGKERAIKILEAEQETATWPRMNWPQIFKIPRR